MSSTGIGDVVEQSDTREGALFIDGVGRCVDVSIVSIEVDDLGSVGRAEGFGKDERSVVDRAYWGGLARVYAMVIR